MTLNVTAVLVDDAEQPASGPRLYRDRATPRRFKVPSACAGCIPTQIKLQGHRAMPLRHEPDCPFTDPELRVVAVGDIAWVIPASELCPDCSTPKFHFRQSDGKCTLIVHDDTCPTFEENLEEDL